MRTAERMNSIWEPEVIPSGVQNERWSQVGVTTVWMEARVKRIGEITQENVMERKRPCESPLTCRKGGKSRRQKRNAAGRTVEGHVCGAKERLSRSK